jgi:hypothetical protein
LLAKAEIGMDGLLPNVTFCESDDFSDRSETGFMRFLRHFPGNSCLGSNPDIFVELPLDGLMDRQPPDEADLCGKMPRQ